MALMLWCSVVFCVAVWSSCQGTINEDGLGLVQWWG